MVSVPPATEQPVKTVAIIGGGLGGVVLAIGLLRRNIPIHIYQSAASFAEIGAGVTIGPNAVRALSLNSPDLLEAFNKHVTQNATTHDSFLAFRRGIPLSPHDPDKENLLFDLTNDESAPNWTASPARSAVHRAKFLDEMVRFIPEGAVSFKKSLVKIEDVPVDTVSDSGVKLTFADGTSVVHAAVIGCDGVRSAARKYVHGEKASPTFSGEYAYRALVPADVMISTMGFERAMNGQCVIGPGGTITTYPVEKGESVNVVAIRTRPGSEWKGESWLAPATTEELLEDFKGWDERLVGLLVKYGLKSKWAIFQYLHDRPYYKGRVCLLGDSAHAMTPNLGAGAGQAMEDGYVLAALMGERPPRTAEDVERVFAAYDAVRRPRTQEVVRLSHLCGRTYSHQQEGVGGDYEKMRAELVDRVKWVLDEDLEAHFEKAKAMLW
ncbi:salicylate hydroxylase [Podospora aff. communis PSN243]|uniref:Salicylate hydroxylase n=1 Tax=Podospora aff. communis PSN243 TaxID=3040156 RepID=A0AAV9GD80_9PEZI|nr:salicylate hydroxylase [Podospora aff. communis PSN243]